LSNGKESEDDNEEGVEPEDEGRDSPNFRMSDLDWLATLSMTQLQSLQEAVLQQKAKKENVPVIPISDSDIRRKRKTNRKLFVS
jgi:hypothetical protein